MVEQKGNKTDSQPQLKIKEKHLSTLLYYKRLKRRLRAVLLIAFLTPLAILSLYFHLQFNYNLKENGKQHLTILAESQRNTIDLFLQERVVNIFTLFHGLDFSLFPTADDMRLYLQKLREMSDSFVDVGFLDNSDIQIGYAGPFSYLQGKDYSNEYWLQKLMSQEQKYYISDIYLGFRQKPHFTIAVRQIVEGKSYILRATLDPDKFYMFLRGLGRGKSAESEIINHEGKYQVVDPEKAQPLALSNYFPPDFVGSGAQEIKRNGKNELVAYAWLNEVPWVLIVRQPLEIAYAPIYKARKILITATGTIVLILITSILIITEKLLTRAQMMEESRWELKNQLLHAAKLVSVGELAGGVAHEINNPLAIISSECGLIKDMLDPQFGMECSPELIRKELDKIDAAVFRAKNITQKLLNLVRKTEPKLVPVNLNNLLHDVVKGIKEKEFAVSNIKLEWELEPDIPSVLVDPEQIRQVFLNIINNAGDAIGKNGTITIKTTYDDENVKVTISDTGVGMTSEQMAKIFLPFYTTKEVGKGTGLGLSISLSIVEAFGGRIEVQSMPGRGSSFTVTLPQKGIKET